MQKTKARNNFKMEKEHLYQYVQDKLSLKLPILLLKDLNYLRFRNICELLFSN